MRNAALMIATLGDDFAPSFARRFRCRIDTTLAFLRRALAARRHLGQLRRLDPHLLDDLGLKSTDLDALDPRLSSLAATRLLARAAEERLREERWRRT